MQRIMIASLALILAGCSTKPPTRAEVVAYVSAKKMGSKLDEVVVSRNYDDVVSGLKKRAEECLTYTRSHRHHVAKGITQQPVMNYWVSTRPVGANKTEITFHAGRNTRDENAKGAAIRAATDVHRLGPGKTRVVTYGSSTFGQGVIGDAVKQWAAGKPAECPEIFFE